MSKNPSPDIDLNDTSSDTSFEEKIDDIPSSKERKTKGKSKARKTKGKSTKNDTYDCSEPTQMKAKEAIKTKPDSCPKIENIKKSNGQGTKTTKSCSKIDYYKKCISLLGIRLNYGRFFDGCQSDDEKIMKLVDRIKAAGIEGRPTFDACKKRRKSLALENELDELDQNVILDSKSRKRKSRDTNKV
ncbi:hypothetical protein RF11_09792 [Thelohanellus kitauei]|uniref:HIRA-interacting protein 3 n=1 Tax=Thelohanellus kitauei TaxID=669202 RepID=A0A0C2J604_THEKT|nr:hypothetical protein RF11_09792 [Thelohanellus kitauei]